MELYSAIEKKELLPSATPCMDLEGIMLSERSDREREIAYDIPYMWNLKRNNTNELIYKAGTDLERTNLRSLGGGVAGKDFSYINY